jgi:hypothetical protein
VSPIEIRDLRFDANGDAVFELWANAGAGTVSADFEVDLRVGVTTTPVWTPADPIAGWAKGELAETGRLVAEASGPGDLTGSVVLGTVTVDLAPGQSAVQVDLVQAALGGSAAPAFSTQMARQVTPDAGRFALTDLADDLYALGLDRSAADSGAGAAITSADALAALKIAVGRNPNLDPDGTGPEPTPMLSPYQLIAADVNEDGKVTAADALAILKMAVRRADAPAREWIFVREDADFWNESTGSLSIGRSDVSYGQPPFAADPAIAPERNFVAVLKGDVNGSWMASGSLVQTLDQGYFDALAQTLGVPVGFWA